MRLSKRSPILRPLLKLPGQTVDEDLQEFVDDQFLAPLLVLAIIGAMCIVEWTGYLRSAPRNPWFYSYWFIGAAVVIAVHWRSQWRRALALKLGRDGERAVAEYLNIRLEPVPRVFHGVPIEGGIADHVVICAHGIFVIETKARTLPSRGEPVVHVSDTSLRVSGFKPDRDPITQVQGYVDGLNRILAELSITKILARGIVLFPSWKIIDDRRQMNEIWAIEPKDLPDRFSKEPVVFTPEEVLSITRKLASYIRPTS